MGEVIMEDFDLDIDNDDLFDIPDYEDTTPSQQQMDYAISLVGKYCECKDKNALTPFLSNLFCKVIAVNDYARGGNPSQVKITVYQNNQMLAPKIWMIIPSHNTYQVVDSGWLILTDKRPTFKNYIVSTISSIARLTVSEIAREGTGFKYSWWKGNAIWQHTPPIINLLSAIYDFGRAFKYGIYLDTFQYHWRA